MLDPTVRLHELYERSRKLLHSGDLPAKRQFADIQLEIDRLRIRHPHITERLESLYHQAHPGDAVTAGRLIAFAHERNLLLTGDPYPKKMHRIRLP